MKNLIFVLCGLFSSAALAGESYGCVGLDRDGDEARIELKFKDMKAVTVVDMEGDEKELTYDGETSRNKIFANYEYDGYGGSLELKLPKKFQISGDEAMEEFRARFVHKAYSELGHVGTYSFSGTCQRQDN